MYIRVTIHKHNNTISCKENTLPSVIAVLPCILLFPVSPNDEDGHNNIMTISTQQFYNIIIIIDFLH